MSSFRIQLFGALMIPCDQCGAPAGETCTPPALDCSCGTCRAILRAIAAKQSEGCAGGRRTWAGRIYEQDPTIEAPALLAEATRQADDDRARRERDWQAKEARRQKTLATRARNKAEREAASAVKQ
jgi:hypothetical protein